MAELYRVGIGLDLVYGDLDPIVPQPASPEGVQIALRDFGADGIITEQGLFLSLQFNVLGNATSYQVLLDQFGLETQTRQAVTVWAPDFERIYRLYSGYAIRPLNSLFRTFPRNVRILVRDLYRLA